MRRNGGTRTPDTPEGSPSGPAWEIEGTQMAVFAGELFEVIADAGSLPTAEHPAPDGRYPKAYDLGIWRKILRRRDVLVVPVDQCEYGLSPADASGPEERYRKRSWLVTCVRRLQEVARRCSGAHTHVELKGTDAVTGQKRTSDAGR